MYYKQKTILTIICVEYNNIYMSYFILYSSIDFSIIINITFKNPININN